MFKYFVKISRPIFLFLATITYTLGASIAHYLGRSVHLITFGLGLLAFLTLLFAALLLAEFFRPLTKQFGKGKTSLQRGRFRMFQLQVSFAALTLSTGTILTLWLTHSLNSSSEILFVTLFLLLVVYAIPPMRLSESGYGELALAIILGTLLPALAFLLQYNQLHRLVFFTTFPLTLFALAFLLVNNFTTFATDVKIERHTLLTRLTWQRAIPIHHGLVLAAFMFFAIAPLMDYPWALVWPVFLALPFAATQIIWLQRIANGGRTMWNFLVALASATFGLTAYLLMLTYWIR